MRASVIGLRQTEQASRDCASGRWCVSVAKLSAGLDALVVRPSSLSPETARRLRSAANRKGEKRIATHQQGRDIQGTVTPGRVPGPPGLANLDCLLLSSVLAL